jgi:translation initiation factor 1 (eIF-1/SUI1)
MSGSLRDLLSKAGLSATAPAEPPSAHEPAASPPAAPTWAPKVIVRISRKGRGGKVATTIEGATSGREQLVDMLKRQLGAGGRVEGEMVVVNGDHVERIARWIESQGVERVVRA